jgi:hypothetical protein
LKKETKGEYGAAILRTIDAASQPLDVEKIRVKCGIGNWQTALKHCLELLYEDKIQGTKTSKSWVFWPKSWTGIRYPLKVVTRWRLEK